MFVYLSTIKDDLADLYNNLKGHKGLPLASLTTYFKGESRFFYRKLPYLFNLAYKEVLERSDIINLIQVGEELKSIHLPSKVNKRLRLRFLDYLHMARNHIIDIDASKGVSENYSEFECFYQHLRRKRKDEANTKLQVVCCHFQYQVRKYFFRDEKKKWERIEFRDSDDLDLTIKDVRSSAVNIFGTPHHIASLSFFKSVVKFNEKLVC